SSDGLRAGDGTPRTHVLPRVVMCARPDGGDSLGVGHKVLSALYCEREPGSIPDRLLPGKENLWTMLPTLSKGWAPFPCSGSERPVLGQGRRSSTVGGPFPGSVTNSPCRGFVRFLSGASPVGPHSQGEEDRGDEHCPNECPDHRSGGVTAEHECAHCVHHVGDRVVHRDGSQPARHVARCDERGTAEGQRKQT